MITYPILMADIINSRVSEPEKTIYQFNEIIDFINKKFKDDIISPLTITLGDEFQGITRNIQDAITIIFSIEEYIISHEYNLKLRYVLNIGKIETKINNDIAYGMLGEGLTKAREELNNLKTSKNRILIITDNIFYNQIINDLFKIYQNYIEQWKNKDIPYLREFIINKKNYREVAELLNLNISSSWRRVKTLNIDEYFTIKKLIINLTDKIYV